jgi:hypothetical protein
MSIVRATVHVDLPDLWPHEVTNMPNQSVLKNMPNERRRGFY